MVAFSTLWRGAALIGLCLGLTACANRGSDQSGAAANAGSAAGPAAKAADQRRYPAQVQESFLKQCTSNGGTDAICRCTLNKVEQRYNLLEFTKLANEMSQSGRLDPEVTGFVNACRIESQ